MNDIADLVDLGRYPVEDVSVGQGYAFAEECKAAFSRSGLCMLPGFIRPAALDALVSESSRYLDHAFFCDSTHNAYLTDSDPDDDDVGRRQEQTYVGSVPYDRIPREALLESLYQWDPLKTFIGRVLDKSPFYRFEDPFGACSVNVFVDGGRHGWHFDESEFTVTLMLQAPEQGGEFEYAPNIRKADENFDEVARVLDGRSKKVTTVTLEPGDLQIFRGRYSLHRVAPLAGRTPRFVAILSYVEEPGMVATPERCKQLYGRALPIHYERAGLRADDFID